MRFEKIRVYIEKRLLEELSAEYTYHSYIHTQDVLKAALLYAELEELAEKDIELLKVAVLFHDSGFLINHKEHEMLSCELARSVLPHFDYSEDEIKIICGMVMATKIPQNPRSKLEQIICDADLDYLGRTDFWEIGALLFKELSYLTIVKNEIEWNKIQLNFLENHSYFTQHAIDLRHSTKQKHLQQVKLKIDE